MIPIEVLGACLLVGWHCITLVAPRCVFGFSNEKIRLRTVLQSFKKAGFHGFNGIVNEILRQPKIRKRFFPLTFLPDAPLASCLHLLYPNVSSWKMVTTKMDRS